MERSPERKIWQLLAVSVAPPAEELASAILFDLGAGGLVTLEENAERVKLGAYFDASRDGYSLSESVRGAMASAGRLHELLTIELSEIPDQDWMEKWKEGFEAIEIGARLLVAPSWKRPAESGRVVIQIDPGQAFGTGTHETTRMCLEQLEARWRGGRLLDAGTGTGILAIAAALLAPDTTAVAIDIDPLAVEAARENAAINGVTIDVREAPPSQFADGNFDCVVANLTAEVIIALLDDLTACLKPSGEMILSGILTELAPDVETALEKSGFAVVERRAAGEWSALVARRSEG